MRVILVELAYLVAIVAAVGTLVGTLVVSYTPAGIRWRQERNRRMAEREAARREGLECPTHGFTPEDRMVRLPTGERICPRCYQETL